jgi:hypothetical protein
MQQFIRDLKGPMFLVRLPDLHFLKICLYMHGCLLSYCGLQILLPIVTMIAVGLILFGLKSMFAEYPAVRLTASSAIDMDTSAVPYYNDG